MEIHPRCRDLVKMQNIPYPRHRKPYCRTVREEEMTRVMNKIGINVLTSQSLLMVSPHIKNILWCLHERESSPYPTLL